MPFYEVIFENGTHSVMCAEDDAEALAGANEQHRRAKAGESAGPAGGPAERVVKMLKYDEHPGSWNEDDVLPEDQLLSELKQLIKESKDENGIVAVGKFASDVRALSHPMVNSPAHESNYKMKEAATLKVDE